MRRLRALFLDFWDNDNNSFLTKIVLLMIYPATIPIVLLGGLLFLRPRSKHGRIRITRVNDEPRFTRITHEALALVEKHDPRRYALLQKELRFIYDTPSVAFAEYDAVYKRCKINFGLFDFDWKNESAPNYKAHREWYVALYAAAIVHEATHGRLYGMGFPYTKRTRLRIERICTREERRFAARLPQTQFAFAEHLVSPFDASRWEYSWNTPRHQQMKDSFRRAMKQIKKRND